MPEEHAIRGVHSVTFTEADLDATAGLLTEQLGFRLVNESGPRARFDVAEGGAGARVDVVAAPGAPRGLVAAGTVHHVAWRAPDEPTEASWREDLVDAGLRVTEIIDRQYFKSIYFREPGGVLLEIATDPPGFTRDEPLMELGRQLKLPPWLEPRREQIAAALPVLKLPGDPVRSPWRGRGRDSPRPGRPPPRLARGRGGQRDHAAAAARDRRDEHSLLPLAEALDSAAAVLAVRGAALEGATRGSSAVIPGGDNPNYPFTLDLDDLRVRTEVLADFVARGGVRLRLRPGGRRRGRVLQRRERGRGAAAAPARRAARRGPGQPELPLGRRARRTRCAGPPRGPAARRPPRPDRPAGAGRAAGQTPSPAAAPRSTCAGTRAATSSRRPPPPWRGSG